MSKRICAVVVTFRRPELLKTCLRALQAQTRLPDTILVVDNNSNDGTLELVAREFPHVETLPLGQNLGGAGGFHHGLKWALENKFDFAWVMDDDGVPAPDCLEILLNKVQLLEKESGKPVVCGAICVQRDDATQLSFPSPLRDEFGASTREVATLEKALDAHRVLPGWAAFMNSILLPRPVLETAGLPRAEMFIWGDEVEYAKRIKAAGFPLYTVFDAVHVHPADRIQWQTVGHPQLTVYAGQLDWKAFCFFRNAGLIAKNYGRGKGVTMLLRYIIFYLILRRFDMRSWRFFLRAYTAGWRGDFSKKVPY